MRSGLISSFIPVRGIALLAFLLAIVAASCSPLQEEATETGPSQTEAGAASSTAAPSDPTFAVATTEPVTTTTVPPTTAAGEAPTTTTTVSNDAHLLYLSDLWAARIVLSRYVEDVRDINYRWDTRPDSRSGYLAAVAALEEAVQRGQAMVEGFELLAPPTNAGLSDLHEAAAIAVRRMPELVSEMLEGLQSTDTGQARRASLVRLVAAFDIFAHTIDQVAALVGETGPPTSDDAGTQAPPDPETTTPETTTPETTTPETTTPETTTPETTTPETTTDPATAPGITAHRWRPGMAEEALGLVDPASVEADHWERVEESAEYGTQAFYAFHHFNAPLAAGQSLTQQHQEELTAFGRALSSARTVLEGSTIYYPYRYDLQWSDYPNRISVRGAYPRGETRQVVASRSGTSWNVAQRVDVPPGPPLHRTTPFAEPRWADTANSLGRNCSPVEDLWERDAAVTDSCTLNALRTALNYLWTESSALRQRAVRDGHVLTSLLRRLDNQDNAYLHALYGEQGRRSVTNQVRRVRWAGNWAGASMIILEYQNTHADRPLTNQEKADAIEYFTGLAEQGIEVDSRFLEGDFTLGFAWQWESALMVRTSDGTWRMSFRSFCEFHRSLYVVEQDRFLCPSDPTPHFPDSLFHDRDLWPPNQLLYYHDPRGNGSPRFTGRYLGVPPS